jgi:hypothetical protein
MLALPLSRRVLAVSLALVAGVAVVSQSLAQEAGRAPAPGPEVARVAQLAGEWNLEITFDGNPAEHGTSSARIMGGGWLIEDVKATYGGEPFEGHGVFGWDGKKGKYVSVWVDSGEPTLSQHASTWNEARHSFIGEPEEMDMGAGPMRMLPITEVLSPDEFVFTLTPDKADAKPMVKIRYTRKT